MWWVMSTTVMPCSRQSRVTVATTSRRPHGVEHGRRLVEHDAPRAAWPARPRWPRAASARPESRCGACRRYSYMPTALSASSTRRRISLGLGTPRILRREGHVRPPRRSRQSGCPGSGTPGPPSRRTSQQPVDSCGGVYAVHIARWPAVPAGVCRSRAWPASLLPEPLCPSTATEAALGYLQVHARGGSPSRRPGR